MATVNQSRLLSIAWTAVVLALAVAACAYPTGAKGEETSRADPFSSRMETEEGIAVEWSGYAQGYRSGEESTFELTLHNGSQEIWSGLYCMQLLDRDGVIATLVQSGFSVQSGESWSGQVPIRFPDALAEGAYGLALTIPGRLSSVTTIQVGKVNDTFGGPWPQPVCP